MSVYLVTWDLNKEKPNYVAARKRFLDRLDQYNHIKDPGLDSVRFIDTSWSAFEISADLRQYLDDNDKIFITRIISGNHQGWLNRNVWDWINARI